MAALRAATDRLVGRVGHWSTPRWTRPAAAAAPGLSAANAPSASNGAGPAGAPTRAELIFRLIQQLADVCAEVEGRTRRPVPRLSNDAALPDQLRVMVADLIAATPPEETLWSAASLVDATHHAL